MALVLYAPSLLPIADLQEIYIAGSINKMIRIDQRGKGTGKILWPAAELMSKYLAENDLSDCLTVPDSMSWSWDKKRVLELGSGLGLLTISLLLLGSHVVATDGEGSVVEQLNKNVTKNFVEYNVDNNGLEKLNYQGLVHLWGTDVSPLFNALINATEGCDESNSPVFDVLVASDVVYGEDESVWNLLLNSICQISAKNPKQMWILLAQTERYRDIEDRFYVNAADRLQLVKIVELTGIAECCLHHGARSISKLYIFLSKKE